MEILSIILEIRDNEHRLIDGHLRDLKFNLNVPDGIESEYKFVENHFRQWHKDLSALMPQYKINMTGYKLMGPDKHSKTWSSWYSYYGSENRFLQHT